MSESQIPFMVVLALLGGCCGGVWTIRRNSIAVALLVGTIVLDIAGWMTYGFIANWQPSWGIADILFGILYAGPGMTLYTVAPALIGFGVGLVVARFIRTKGKVVP